MNKNQHEDLLFQNLNILSDFKKNLYIHINFFFKEYISMIIIFQTQQTKNS